MASTPVQLVIGDYTRDVEMFSYSFNQSTDKEGQLTGIPRGGRITIRVKAYNNGDSELLNWMVTPYMSKSGSIKFTTSFGDSKMKEIQFTDAYCIDYKEYWEDQAEDHEKNATGLGQYEEIVISCREIKNGDVTYTNDWK